MDYTPEELKYLNSLVSANDLKVLQEQNQQPTQQETQAEQIARLQSQGIDTSAIVNPNIGLIDSNLGVVGNAINRQIGDEMPKNIASALKNLTPDSLGLNPNYNQYIAKQNEEAKRSLMQITPEKRDSTANTVGNVIGGVASFGVPIVASALTGNPLVVGSTIAGMSAVGGGASANEFEDRRRIELDRLGYKDPVQIQQILDQEQKDVFAKATTNELATNLVSMGVGGTVGRRSIGALKGARNAALADVIPNATSGALDEEIVGGALDGGPDENIRMQKAALGVAVGSVVSGGFGALEGRRNKIDVDKSLSDAQNSRVEEKEVSIPLHEDGAKKRLKFLEERNTDPNITFEIRDAIINGEVIPNRKQIFALKNIAEEPITPEVRTTENIDNPEVKDVNTIEVVEPKVEVKPKTYQEEVKERVQSKPVEDLTTIDPSLIRSGERQIDPTNTKLEERTITERDPETNIPREVKAYVEADRDNLGHALTLEQSRIDRQNFEAEGKNIINEFKAEPLKIEELSDKNRTKKILIDGQTKKPENQSLINVPNINILDRSQKGNYHFKSRANIDSNGNNVRTLEFLSSVNISDFEPFLKGARDLKDGQEITIVREKTARFPENTAVYVDGVKVGKMDYSVAREFSKFLDANAVDKIQAKLISVDVPYSKKDKNVKNRQLLDGDTLGRTALIVKAELNANADNISYTVSKNGKKIEVPVFESDKIGNGKIEGVNVKQDAEFLPKEVTEELRALREQDTQGEVIKKIAPIKELIADSTISPKEKSAELVKSFKNLQDEITKLNAHNENNTIKVLSDFKGSDTVFSAKDRAVIKKIKDFNGEGPGSYYRDDDGNSYVYLNLDNIRDYALRSDISVEDYAKFVYTHEVLGHGALRTFFKTQKALNDFLDKTYQNGGDVIKYLVDKKTELYGLSAENEALYNKGIVSLAQKLHFREMMEEVIADLANGKVSYEENGKVVVKDIESFAKEFAVIRAETYDTPDSIIKQFLDFIRGVFNDIMGNDVFKTYEDSKAELNSIADQLKEFKKTLNSNSPMVKDREEFITTSSPEVLKAIGKFSNNPDFIYSDEYNIGWGRAAADLMLSIGKFSKVPWIGTMQGKAHFDKPFARGLELVQRISETDNMVDSVLNRAIKDIYLENAIGWKKGVNKESIEKIDRALFESEVNNKQFTDAELRQKFNLDDRGVIAYESLSRNLKLSREFKYMSKMYKEAFKYGLDSEAMYDKYRNITEYTFDDFVDSITRDLASVNPKGVPAVTNLVAEFNLAKDGVSYDIPPTGKYYVEVRDKNDQTVYFEQFNSDFQAKQAKKRIEAKNRDNDINVVIDKVPNKIEDLDDIDNPFNNAVGNYKSYMMQQYKDGKSNVVPFRYYQSIFASIDATSKNVGVNMNLPTMNRYINNLKEEQNNELANQLEKLRDYELSQDSVVAGKIRGINSIYNLGGSVASAFANMMSIPMTVLPYLTRYDGGAKALWDTKKLIKDWTLINGNMSRDEMVNHLLKNYIKTDNPLKAKQDLNRLIDAGILNQIGDFDLVKIKDGVNVTNKFENSKSLIIRSFMYPFAKSEKVNRLATGIAALNTAYKNGQDGYSFTKQTIYETQGFYGKAGRPLWARSGIGQLIYQFKTYPMNYVELLSKLAFAENPNGKGRDYAALVGMLGILAVMGGAKSLPFVTDAGEVLDIAGRATGLNSDANSGKLADDVAKSIAGNNAEYITHGLFGNLLNMQQRIAFNNIIPGLNTFDPANKDKAKSLKEVGGPTVSNASNIIDAIDQFSRGNFANSAFAAAPSGARGIMQGIEGLRDGEFTDKRGKKIADVDIIDSIARIGGFQPNNITKIYRELEKVNIQKQNMEYYKSVVHELVAESNVENNRVKRLTANKMVDNWNKGNPKNKISINNRSVRMLEKGLTETIKEKSLDRAPKNMQDELEENLKNL